MRVIFAMVLALASTFSSQYSNSQEFPQASRQSPPQLPKPPAVDELLQRVGEALRKNSYRGRITYEHSGRLEVVDIEHLVVDGVEHDFLRFLNGPQQELIKSGRRVDCETKGTQLFKGEAFDGGGGQSAKINQSYRSKYLGSERVAGKESWVVQMIPRDRHRHSFVLAVDQASFLPTKTLYVGSNGSPLERLHFVALETMIEASSKVEQGEFSEFIESEPCPSYKQAATSDWQPQWIPPGFVVSNYSVSDNDEHIETYTDGLASFSVIAKPVTEIAETAVLPGNSVHMEGATVVAMRLVTNQSAPVRVSLVGEIPGETAQRILSSVEHSPN